MSNFKPLKSIVEVFKTIICIFWSQTASNQGNSEQKYEVDTMKLRCHDAEKAKCLCLCIIGQASRRCSWVP